MTDHTLIRQYMRLRERQGRVTLEIALIVWDGPYTPRVEWELFHRWFKHPSPGRLMRVQRQALDAPRFFARCATCGKRHNRGHMAFSDICQSCAERHFGIVY